MTLHVVGGCLTPDQFVRKDVRQRRQVSTTMLRLSHQLQQTIIKIMFMFAVHTTPQNDGQRAAQPPHAGQTAHCILTQCHILLVQQPVQAGPPDPPPSIHHVPQGLAAAAAVPARPPAGQGRQRQGVAVCRHAHGQARGPQAAAAPRCPRPARQPAARDHGACQGARHSGAQCTQMHTRLDHPHVVAMHAVHLTPTHVVLVLDAMLGSTLLGWMQARAAGRPRGMLCMEEAEACYLFKVCRVLRMWCTHNVTARALGAAALPCVRRGPPRRQAGKHAAGRGGAPACVPLRLWLCNTHRRIDRCKA